MLLEELVTTETPEVKEISSLAKIAKHCNSLTKTIQLLNHAESNGTSSFEREEEIKLLTESNMIKNACQDYLAEKGHSSLCYEFGKNNVSVKIEKYGSGYKFIFESLLPARGNIINQSVFKGYLRTIDYDYKTAIEDAIANFSKDETITFFQERVAVEITHFFSEGKQLKDYDNFESKPITDIITFHFIKDDSPEYVSVHFDYQKTQEKPHTEIVIIPEREYYKSK